MVEILFSIYFIHLNWWSNDTDGYFAGFAVFLEHRRVLQKCHLELCVCTKIVFQTAFTDICFGLFSSGSRPCKA